MGPGFGNSLPITIPNIFHEIANVTSIFLLDLTARFEIGLLMVALFNICSAESVKWQSFPRYLPFKFCSFSGFRAHGLAPLHGPDGGVVLDWGADLHHQDARAIFSRQI